MRFGFNSSIDAAQQGRVDRANCETEHKNFSGVLHLLRCVDAEPALLSATQWHGCILHAPLRLDHRLA